MTAHDGDFSAYASARWGKVARADDRDAEVFRCPDDAYCIGDTAVRCVVVPSEGGAFTIAGSVQILPEGYTTVPFVEGNSRAARKTAIAEAGLVPDGPLPVCTDTALCDTNPRVRPDPGPGSVAAVGSEITLLGSDTLGTPVFLPSSDWEPGDRAQAAHFTGELAVDQDGFTTLDRAGEGAGAEGVVASRIVWPAGYTASLRDQLEVTEDEFWACVKDGVRPDRDQGEVEAPPNALPAQLVYQLIHRAGVPEGEVATMTMQQAMEALTAFWSAPRIAEDSYVRGPTQARPPVRPRRSRRARRLPCAARCVALASSNRALSR